MGTPAQTKAGMGPWSKRDWMWALVLVVAVLVTYSPIVRAGFIWDDEKYLTNNPVIVGPLGLGEIWTTSAADICPLTLTTWWFEHALWGLAPLPYHLVNVLMQAACGVLLWRVLLYLKVPGAWLGAALWTLHPVQVESVAWISEMKNTESGLFFLLSILFFVRGLKFEGGEGRRDYALTLVFAGLAMASKSSTMILPLVLCLCAWWMEGRWQARLAKIAPVFLLSIFTGLLAISTFKLQGNSDPISMRSWPERFVDAGEAIWTYLGKLLWPHPLMSIYPLWDMPADRLTSWLPLVAVGIAGAILWLKRESWGRPSFFAFAYFLIVLLPTLGVINQSFMHFSVVGDHMLYLAGMGPLALAGAGIKRGTDFLIPGKVRLQLCLGAGLLVVLGSVSWRQVGKYESPTTLWTDAVAHNPNSFAVVTNLGNALLHEGRVNEAQVYYLKAISLDPKSAQAYSNLGGSLVAQGRLDQAILGYQKALRLDPNRGRTEADLAFVLNQKGQVDEAIIHYQKSLQIEPGYADAHFNLGTIFLQRGQVDNALPEFEKAVEARPNYAEAHNNLGAAFLRKGQVNEAIAQFQIAVELKPEFSEARQNLDLAQGAIHPSTGQGK